MSRHKKSRGVKRGYNYRVKSIILWARKNTELNSILISLDKFDKSVQISNINMA